MKTTGTNKKPLCYVLTGPTASGKTALSLQVSQRLGCEIVCMDSMQIYQRMDIGTAKPTAEEQSLVRHHMLDIVAPTQSFSVVQYCEMAESVCREIHGRGKTPLFVGGTGFYLRALRNPMPMGIAKGDEKVRARLEAEASEPQGRQKLHQRLREVDPATAARLPVGDVRRVIRAL